MELLSSGLSIRPATQGDQSQPDSEIVFAEKLTALMSCGEPNSCKVRRS
jgi:hypothetical protein